MGRGMVLCFVLIVFRCLDLYSQTDPGKLYSYGIGLKAEGKYEDALTVFKNLLKTDSTDVRYLSETSFLYSHLGGFLKSENARSRYYKTAEYLALKGIKLDDKNGFAHYAYSLAIARQAEFASNKVKIKNAVKIREEAEKALELNPRIGGAYHILGRWHRELASISSFERAMASAFYDNLPEGSLDESIRNFEKAIQQEPLLIIHYYEIAITYKQRGKVADIKNAEHWLKKALMIKIRNPQDQYIHEKCEALLKKIQ